MDSVNAKREINAAYNTITQIHPDFTDHQREIILHHLKLIATVAIDDYKRAIASLEYELRNEIKDYKIPSAIVDSDK